MRGVALLLALAELDFAFCIVETESIGTADATTATEGV